MSNKKFILAGTVIVAVVVGYLAFRGANVGNQGTQGTIGAASRYQSEQVTNADIALDKPEVAAFIQSDTFRKLAANPAFREAARSEGFNKFLGSDELRRRVADGSASQMLDNLRVQELLRSTEFATAMTSETLNEAFRKIDWSHLVEGNHLSELLKLDALRVLARNTDFHRLAEEAHRRENLTLVDFKSIVEGSSLKGTDAIRTLEGNKHFEAALHTGFLDLFRNVESAQFAIDGLRTMSEGNSAFMDALKIDGFKEFMDALSVTDFAAVRDVAGSPDLLRVLGDASLREAAAKAELGEAAHAGLDAAVARLPE